MQKTEPIPARRGALIRDASGALSVRRFIVRVPGAADVVLEDKAVVVGSGDVADVRLSDTTVSGRHVELVRTAGGLLIRDLQSTNGTFLGDVRISEAWVDRTAKLTVGRTTLLVDVAEEHVDSGAAQAFGTLRSRTPAVLQLFGHLERIAESDSPLLLVGESGTGKERWARELHKVSSRAKRPFVVFDCAAAARELFESELFGHVVGAFSGAVKERKGAFLDANKGTLLLDQINELPLDLQPKLLRMLEAGAVQRVGESGYRRADVRVVSTSRLPLKALVEEGRFRLDLYHRVATLEVQLPPLRERLDDLPLLVEELITGEGRPDKALGEAELLPLRTYAWPGNVRELSNFVRRTVLGLPESPAGPAPQADEVARPFREAKQQLVDDFTREYFTRLLAQYDGNVTEVAHAAGMARPHVHEILARYQLRGSRGGS